MNYSPAAPMAVKNLNTRNISKLGTRPLPNPDIAIMSMAAISIGLRPNLSLSIPNNGPLHSKPKK